MEDSVKNQANTAYNDFRQGLCIDGEWLPSLIVINPIMSSSLHNNMVQKIEDQRSEY